MVCKSLICSIINSVTRRAISPTIYQNWSKALEDISKGVEDEGDNHSCNDSYASSDANSSSSPQRKPKPKSKGKGSEVIDLSERCSDEETEKESGHAQTLKRKGKQRAIITDSESEKSDDLPAPTSIFTQNPPQSILAQAEDMPVASLEPDITPHTASHTGKRENISV